MEELGALLPEVVGPSPGPNTRAWVERLAQVECPAITARRDRRRARGVEDPIVWAQARGANVVDVDGNRYVDLSGGFAVAAVGHAHPRVVAAAQRQAERLVHGMGDLFPTREKVLLGEALARVAPGELSQSILGLTGSDAVEAAIKTAMIATGRSRVLAFHGSYHGMSLGALGVSGYRSAFRQPFASFAGAREVRLPYGACASCPIGHTHPGCELACVSHVARVLDDDTFGGEDVAAVIVEAIQGRGGDVVPPPGWLAALRKVTRERGILLILDEIYTGFGRTGRWFACEHEGVEPDLLCVGKALGGGFPVSACIGTPEVMGAWGRSTGEAIHTSTFLGHPVAAAVAVEVLDILESEGLVARAAELGRHLEDALASAVGDHPRVREIRGRGLMLGIALQDRGGEDAPGAGVELMQALLSRGYIASPGGATGDVLSLSPPFVITQEQLSAFVEALTEALGPR